MKNKFILLIILFLNSLVFQAQTIETITTPGSTSSKMVPIDSGQNENRTQFIYLGSEISKSGNIKKLSFKVSSYNSPNISEKWAKWKVSLKQTTKTQYASNTAETGLTQVFDGLLKKINSSYSLYEIELDKDFYFDHTKNLIVDVLEYGANKYSYNINWKSNNRNNSGLKLNPTDGSFINALNIIPVITLDIDTSAKAPTTPTTTPSRPLEYCEGTNLELTAEDAGTGATYEWYKGSTLKSSNKDLIINTVSLSDAGTYSLTVTKNGCSDSADIIIKINTTPDTPTLGNTIASCSTAGSSKITNYDATLTYIFTPTGPTVNAAGEIQNMTIATSYTVIAQKGTCDSGSSVTFKNDAKLPTPNTPILTNVIASCATDGTSEIANYDATVTYIFTPTGPTINAAGEIQNMTIATSYTVIAQKGTCDSGSSASFKNDVMLPTPKAIIKIK